MIEFKVNKGLIADVNQVKRHEQILNESYNAIAEEGTKTLKTSIEYIEQHESIKKLIDLYMALIEKDMGDINKMIEEISTLDENLTYV